MQKRSIVSLKLARIEPACAFLLWFYTKKGNAGNFWTNIDLSKNWKKFNTDWPQDSFETASFFFR